MPLIMTAAFWCDKEEIVVKLFDNAYGFIRRRGDFQFVVINEGACESDHVTPLKNKIIKGGYRLNKNDVNDGEDGRRFRVLASTPTDQHPNWIIQRINGRDLLKIDEKNGSDLKKIPAESKLTTRFH